MSRRGLASMLVALLLAGVPATALADGAGDNQYQDPLAAPTTPKKSKKKTTATTPVTTTQTTTAPASATAGTSASGTSTSSASSSSASQQQLPRTGAPAGLIGLGGLVLAASGLALRRRTAE